MYDKITSRVRFSRYAPRRFYSNTNPTLTILREYETPIFMPVGTKGTIKGLTSQQMESLDCKILLANTYHLGAQPGPDVLDKMGGLHKFMNWKRNILTDSGGFQMVSLFDLADITEEGVKFRNPDDGSMMMLTPEKSVELQNKIGADILMALDDVNSSVDDDMKRFEEATNRTVRWLDRCIAAHRRPKDQCIFAIVQGGLANPILDAKEPFSEP